MGELVLWWVAAEALGILALPFAATLLARLPDRGWALARPLGLLVWGWLIWFPLSLFPALPYSRPVIASVLVVFAGLAVWRLGAVRGALTTLVVREWRYLVASEAVFTGAYLLMAWERSFTPAVVDTEKYMDVAFLASFWRAPHLPAPDPWLAGYSINYYSFGHYLMGTLAKLLGTQPALAFNTAIVLTFALTASAVFGLVANLVAARRDAALNGAAPDSAPTLGRAAGWGVVGTVLVLVLGNLAGARTWWQNATAAAQAEPAIFHGTVWAWWTHPQFWLGYDWWTPSRAVPSTITEFPAFSFILADLHAHVLALPFTALAAALALNLLLSRGVGLRVFGDRWSGIVALGLAALTLGGLFTLNGWDLPTYLGLALLALAIGQWIEHGGLSSIFVLNWVAAAAMLAALAVLAYLPFYRGFVSPAQGIGYVPASARTQIGDEFAMFGLPVVLVASLLVLRLVRLLRGAADPVRVSIQHPRWQVTASVATSQDDASLIPAVLVGACLALLALGTLQAPGWRGWTLIWAVVLLAGCALVAWHSLSATTPEMAGNTEATAAQVEASPDVATRGDSFLWCAAGTGLALIAASEVIYLKDTFGGGDLFRMNTVFKLDYQAWLLLGVAASAALAELAPLAVDRLGDLIFAIGTALDGLTGAASGHVPTDAPADAHLALAAAGRQSHLAQAHRPNTSALPELGQSGHNRAIARDTHDTDAEAEAEDESLALSIEAAPPVGPVALRWAGLSGTLLWTAAILVLLGAAAIYPLQATAARTGNFSGSHALDGTSYMAGELLMAGDPAAIAWLNDPAHVSGDPVIVEAVDAQGGEYTHYARISSYTGLPTVIGWVGHEWQWRVNWVSQPGHGSELGTRPADVSTIYTSQDPHVVLGLLTHYQVRYIYVGAMERARYPGVNMDQFSAFLRVVYRAGGVTIYQVR